jgi:adenine-specific DNA-methyltransferase
MHDVDPLEDEVSAYPAVTLIRRRRQRSAVLGQANGAFGSEDAQQLGSC